MLAVLNKNSTYSIGTAVSGSVVIHAVLLAFFLVAIKNTDFFDNSTRAFERSSVTLNFTKPQPVFEKKPLEKMVIPEKDISVLKESKIIKVEPKSDWSEEVVFEEFKKEEPIKELILENNDAPIKEVANNSVIKDANFKGSRIAPKYPKRALMLGLQGTVVIKALIDIKGVIKDVQLLESSGYKVLDDAVTKVAWKWDFEPSYVNGKPSEQWVRAPYNFVIR